MRITRLLVLPLNRPRNEATSAGKGLDECDSRTMVVQARVQLLLDCYHSQILLILNREVRYCLYLLTLIIVDGLGLVKKNLWVKVEI